MSDVAYLPAWETISGLIVTVGVILLIVIAFVGGAYVIYRNQNDRADLLNNLECLERIKIALKR